MSCVDRSGCPGAGLLSMKEETAYARQLFLFGEGKTKPVKNVKRLAELSGAAESTLHDWMARWRRESEELAIRHEDSPYTLALSSDVIAQHSKEVDFLGKQVAKLRKRVDKTLTSSPNYPVYLSSYNIAFGRWEKSSGIQAHFDTAASAMKETAKAKARAEAKVAESGLKSKAKPIDKTRFDLDV
tara:strand:- start:93 stop:647 length:555 start_codon:yes stop_codon:yes gene_type:complete